MFSCSGHIIGFKLCNRQRQHINLSLSLWRRETGVLDTTATYSRWEWHVSLENQMNFTNGDQLMLTIIYYGFASKSELKYVHNINYNNMMILSYIMYYKNCIHTLLPRKSHIFRPKTDLIEVRIYTLAKRSRVTNFRRFSSLWLPSPLTKATKTSEICDSFG